MRLTQFTSLPVDQRAHGRRSHRRHRQDASAARAFLLCGALLCGTVVGGQTRNPGTSINELKRLSVERLMDVEVTSVTRAADRLGGSAAAVAVVTSEDIRRSGASSVPETLRALPGIHVASQTASAWAISSRGFSSVNSEKLLVLSDTRSIYTPLFSGVLWDVQDYLLQDIDRIEVIRGPGATLWGSNAVNGVINITTKSAKDTQGVYAETNFGTEQRASAAARYGGRVGDGGYYRVFGTFVDRDSTVAVDNPRSDDWQFGHIGARTDWETNSSDVITIQGDAYRGTIGQLAPSIRVSGRSGPSGELNVDVSGGNLLGRFRRRRSSSSEFQLRVYYDRTHRDDPSFVDDLHTVDAEVQQRLAIGRHQLTWNVNDRFTVNRNSGKGIFNVEPRTSRDNLASGFIQDEIVVRDPLRLTIGTKLEHNDFSGLEIQPSGRLAWDLSPRRTVWGAVSRAVRVPTRLERDIGVDIGSPAPNTIVRLVGNDELDAESLWAFEAGYRWQVTQPLFIDVTAFHNEYDRLISLEFEAPFGELQTGRTIIPIRNRNLNDGHARGAEVLSTYSPREYWRLSASYSHLRLSVDARGQDLNRGQFLEGATPRHQFGLHSFLDLPASLQFDARLRAVGALRTLPTIMTGEGIPGYAELDLRVAWRGWKRMEISVVGQNLLHDHHVEFGDLGSRGEIERGVYGKVAWGF